ncbi:MAG TPA: hypothetical protein VJ867_05170 [Gemmatimonadaceae bacterium]|nr:hypothetical protein [Gemmatimonadaceae bacterium]
MGWFEPTEIGEQLMPALTNLGPYHQEISHEMHERSLPSGEPIARECRRTLARDACTHRVSDDAGLAVDALRLELHDAAGNVVPTQSIVVQDTEYLMALGGDMDEDIDEMDDYETIDDADPDRDGTVLEDPAPDEFSSALIELGIEDDIDFPDDSHDVSADWESSTLPRYQIHVELVDGRSIPVSDRWKDDPYVQALVAGDEPRTALDPLRNEED